MSRTSSLLLAGAVLAAALAPAAVAGAAPQGKADKAKAEHERIVAYWTPERMKAAKPRDFERRPDGSFMLAPEPKGKPSGESKGKPGGSGGTGTSTVTGASWSSNETSVNERTGKVYFQFTKDDGWICSGAVVDDGGDNDESLVLTAGHCVYDQESGRYATTWLFIPDFDETPTYTCSETEYGCWTAKALVAHPQFTSEAEFNTNATLHDFAVAVVGKGGKSGATDLDHALRGSGDTTPIGSYGLTFEDDLTSSGQAMSAFGYPAAKRYSGSVLTYCSGPVTTDPYNGLTWGLACNMTGGSSGGPWLTTGPGALNLASGEGGKIGSLNSYGYTGLNYMFGPKFDSKAKSVYDTAKGMLNQR